MQIKNKLLFIPVIALCVFGCHTASQPKSVSIAKIFNYDNSKDYEEYQRLDIDSVYFNLLSSTTSTQEENDAVYAAWVAFHHSIQNFLVEKGFNWQVEDAEISIVNKIYFDIDGNVDYYFFNVKTPSVSSIKKAEFHALLQEFCKENTINLKRKYLFSQCGGSSYANDQYYSSNKNSL